MSDALRVFIGPIQALAALAGAQPGARLFELASDSELLVLPLDDDLHDALHASHGTGEWLDSGPRLTTRDLAAGAAASRGAKLAYLEADYSGEQGRQSAVVWVDGQISIRPVAMTAREARSRAPSFWPVNAALRALGYKARPGLDEFTSFGLARLGSSSDVASHGRAVAWRA